MQSKRVGTEKTNQKEGRNARANRVKQGPAFGGSVRSNGTKGGGINRATTGKA